jgi:putative aldouronate transport system substrate-binding protein
MKKFLTVLLMICMLSTAVFAKASNETTATKAGSASVPGWKASASTPITFDWYLHFSWFARHWGDSVISKYITEKTGVTVNFVVPAGNEAEKLNTLIAGDALPDFVTIGWWEGQVNQMIDAGLVYALDELADKYDPYFHAVANPDLVGWYTKEDGHIYGYPNSSYTPTDYETYAGQLTSNESFLVRKDIYEAIGSPDMSTPEGFIKALKAAKAKYPTVNGQPLIPFGTNEFGDIGEGMITNVLPHFLAISPEQNGKFVSSNLGLTENPEYVRWLKCFNEAYNLGLMPTDVFVDRRSQIEEKAAQGRYFALFFQHVDMRVAMDTLYAADPNTVYIAVDGPKNTKGDAHKLGGGGIAGWTQTFISTNCKDPARAIQFLTYLISEEGCMDCFFGQEGVTYNYVDGVPTFTDEVQNLKMTNNDKQENEIGTSWTYWMLQNTAWSDKFAGERPASIAQPYEWSKAYSTSYAAYDGLTLPIGSDEELAFGEIQREWGKVLVKLIQAPSAAEFDKILADFNKFKKDSGIDAIEAIQTELMNEQKAKLGM